MLRRAFFAVAIGFLVSACASAPPPAAPAPPPPPPPAAFDPAGTYDFTVNAQGMELGGVLVVNGSPDAGYTGNMSTDMGGGRISNVTMDGHTMTFTLPDFGVDFELIFEGDEFSGIASGAMGDADIYGVKR